jgi:hypothetical protein
MGESGNRVLNVDTAKRTAESKARLFSSPLSRHDISSRTAILLARRVCCEQGDVSEEGRDMTAFFSVNCVRCLEILDVWRVAASLPQTLYEYVGSESQVSRARCSSFQILPGHCFEIRIGNFKQLGSPE